jgi:hypothetical protein
LKQKRDTDGNPTKKKARLVGGGHRQLPSMYSETASPTARMTSIKVLLQLTASRAYFFRSIDITGAFLHADIDKVIYISVPDPNNIERRMTARQRKSLYGLKQAGKLWYDNLTATLTSFGATPCLNDPCVYVYREPNSHEHKYIAIHVDDLLIVSTRGDLIKKLADFLSARYGEVTNTDASTHLGLKIDRDDSGNITVTQPGLLTKLLDELSLTNDSSTASTPMTEDYLQQLGNMSGAEKFDVSQFTRVVGILIYMCHSRPDLLFAVSIL